MLMAAAPLGGARRFSAMTSSSNRSFARADPPPSAFHPSTSPLKYRRVHGDPFAKSASATSGCDVAQMRSAKPGPGMQGSDSPCAQPSGIARGGGGGGEDSDGE